VPHAAWSVGVKMTEGKVITCRAAVSWAVDEPFRIEEIQVEAPKKGEIRVRIIATGIVCFNFDLLSKLYLT